MCQLLMRSELESGCRVFLDANATSVLDLFLTGCGVMEDKKIIITVYF